jgi:inorganic pyrophosphatase
MNLAHSGILIVGGGIGGLTMALSLHARGLPCQVFEGASEFKPLGVGINMMPHAIRVLSSLGLEDNLKAYGVEAREFTYFNRHGQLIFSEPCGRFAGYEYPHFSIHRADLHQVLYDAVIERLGPDAVALGHRCVAIEQDDSGVTVRFEHAPDQRGGIALAYDGFHSAIRHQFYPEEGPPQFGGINMWRGVTRRKPFLSGASVTRVGAVQRGKMVIYPIREFDDGTQLINWNTEQPRDDHKLNDWATPGSIEDFIEPFCGWNFDWLDIPQLIADADFILEYPMVDRFLYTSMSYPGNYGFVPHTLSEDGDPIDVLVCNTRQLIPGCAINVRPIGALMMEDDSGKDEKIIAVPSGQLTRRYDDIHNYSDMPDITLQQIQHFFEHYKDLEPGKWVRIGNWMDADIARRLIVESIDRAGLSHAPDAGAA